MTFLGSTPALHSPHKTQRQTQHTRTGPSELLARFCAHRGLTAAAAAECTAVLAEASGAIGAPQARAAVERTEQSRARRESFRLQLCL